MCTSGVYYSHGGGFLFDMKRVIQQFWPIFIEQVLGVTIGLLSTAMVAGVSDAAVAAVGLVSSINFVMMNAFIAIATGATVVVAQSVGRQDITTARQVSEHSLVLVTYIGVGVGLLLFIFNKALIGVLFGNAEAEVLADAHTYLVFSALSMPFLAVSSNIGGVMRAMGDMRTPMFGGILSNILNVAVAAVLIKVLDFGVVGAGWGLLISRIAPAFLLFWLLQWGQGPLAHARFVLRVNMTYLRDVLKTAIPSGIDSLIFNGCKLIVQVFMASMGTNMLAAYAILINLTNFVNLPGGALSTLTVSVIGQTYGAGAPETARKQTWILCYLGAGLTAFAALLTWIFIHPLIGFFSPSPDVYATTYDLLIFFILVAPLLWAPSFLLPSAIRAMDGARYTMIVSIASMVLLRVFLAWLLGVHFSMNLWGIWISMFADWLGRGVFFIIPLLRKRQNPTELDAV